MKKQIEFSCENPTDDDAAMFTLELDGAAIKGLTVAVKLDGGSNRYSLDKEELAQLKKFLNEEDGCHM